MVNNDDAMVDDDAVRSLLEGTMNMAYTLDSFGGVDFSLPENSHFFEGWNDREAAASQVKEQVTQSGSARSPIVNTLPRYM